MTNYLNPNKILQVRKTETNVVTVRFENGDRVSFDRFYPLAILESFGGRRDPRYVGSVHSVDAAQNYAVSLVEGRPERRIHVLPVEEIPTTDRFVDAPTSIQF